MKAEKFLEIIGSDFYAGVPDSQLKPLCDCLFDKYGTDPRKHIIAANEGNASAIAAGYHLATGKTAAVYMQNSGEGNIINPLASLLNGKVYAIPVLFIIGWRGEPGVHDEPQHIFQGEITVSLMDLMGVETFIVGKETSEAEITEAMDRFKRLFSQGKQAAFIIRKGALEYSAKPDYSNKNTMNREEIIRHIAKASGDAPIVSTTGKASRELFEIRAESHQGHGRDFLTVGSMGHSSSIALGLAENMPHKKIWCIDGDGAAIMHMGAMAVIGQARPDNIVHIVINNSAHDTVGGMPTAAGGMDLPAIALACGYEKAVSCQTYEELDKVLSEAKESKALMFIEAKAQIGARASLGRPTTTAIQNKQDFMDWIKKS